ncbi:MAG: SMC-Scp complex subunit ScpB [Candidatus Anstonellales archaeon]
MEGKRIIEAALFISGRALSLDELAKLLGTPAKGFVKSLVEELASEYQSSSSSLCIINEGEKYAMAVKGEYFPKVRSFAQELEISKHALKTLALIHNKNGITKRKLFGILGSQIYKDCKELVDKGFIIQKKAGRTTALYVTPKFKSYFSPQ